MNKPLNSGKRIVPKRKYLASLTEKASLTSVGIGMFSLSLLCLLVSVLIVALMPSLIRGPEKGMIPTALFVTALLGYGAWVTFHLGKRSLKEAKQIQTGVPLTRANLERLPAPESLVRASAEPLQEQQAILLRAAHSTETPAEQLLRATEE